MTPQRLTLQPPPPHRHFPPPNPTGPDKGLPRPSVPTSPTQGRRLCFLRRGGWDRKQEKGEPSRIVMRIASLPALISPKFHPKHAGKGIMGNRVQLRQVDPLQNHQTCFLFQIGFFLLFFKLLIVCFYRLVCGFVWVPLELNIPLLFSAEFLWGSL